MKTLKNKAKLIAIITFVLMLTALLTGSQSVHADERAPIAYVSVDPNPIGVGQTMIVNVWLTPSIPGRHVLSWLHSHIHKA